MFAIFHVAEPLNVNGKSNTLVAVSTVYVDVLPINVVAVAPAVYVPPVDDVLKSPAIDLAVFDSIPINPRRSTLLNMPVRATVSVALALKFIPDPVPTITSNAYAEFIAAVPPMLNVLVPTLLAYVDTILEVPVQLKLVPVEISISVTPLEVRLI